jgi:hypothetical protein
VSHSNLKHFCKSLVSALFAFFVASLNSFFTLVGFLSFRLLHFSHSQPTSFHSFPFISFFHLLFPSVSFSFFVSFSLFTFLFSSFFSFYALLLLFLFFLYASYLHTLFTFSNSIFLSVSFPLFLLPI